MLLKEFTNFKIALRSGHVFCQKMILQSAPATEKNRKIRMRLHSVSGSNLHFNPE